MQLLRTIPGIGLITACTLFAAIPDIEHFQNGRGLAAWLGLVPSEHSSGYRRRLGGISKVGCPHLKPPWRSPTNWRASCSPSGSNKRAINHRPSPSNDDEAQCPRHRSSCPLSLRLRAASVSTQKENTTPLGTHPDGIHTHGSTVDNFLRQNR